MNRILTSISIAILALFFVQQTLSAQTYKWVKGGGSNASIVAPYLDEQINHICTDANGNVYALGVIGNGTIAADTFHRSAAYGGENSVFLASYNCAGQMRWAKLIGSQNDIRGASGIVADSHGHIYVAGSFYHIGGTHTLHIGYDTSFSTNPYISSGVIQFDTSGEFNWIRLLGDNTTASVSALANGPILMDAADNVHFIANTEYGAHITPSILTHYGAYDVTFDPSGTLLGTLKLLQDTTLEVDGATLDKVTGKLYVFGVKGGDFSTETRHPYITAFDAGRNQIWTDTISDPLITSSAGCYFSSIVNDDYGNLYLTSGGYGELIYRTDTVKNVLSSIAYPVACVMKMDVSGNLKWIRPYSATTDINGFEQITLMPHNKIAACGVMAGLIVCGTDSTTSYAGEGHNGYFTILDSAGYVHDLQQIHGSGFADHAYAVASDKVGNLFIGGAAASNVWGGSLIPYTSFGGNTDFFVMKYGVECSCTTMPVANYTVTGGTTKTFTYTGTMAGIDSVRWEFGDGGTSTILNPIHPYTYGDTFTACVTVYTSCGGDVHCSDFIIPCIIAPTASYSSSGTGLVRTFTYTGSGLGTGTVSWTFGDGSPAVSGLSVTHTFSGTGTYNVCVTATNPCGSNVSCTTITVTCTTLPVSAFTITGAGASRTFTYTGTTAGLDSVTWSFGDGGNGAGLTISHTYATTGVKNVCAIVHTNCGTNTICHTVTINCLTAITAAFADTGNFVHGFTYTGTTADLDSVGWDYGDTHHDTGKSRIHTYTTAGTYHVCLILYTDCGNDTVCRDIIVIHPSGVETLMFSEIKVFPNPATNDLSITGIQEATTYRIITVSGVNLQSGTLQKGSNNVTLPDISAGMYILEMTGPTGEKNTMRFIKG
jgi:PKD repeat protein